jgi:hypothetical protein
MVKHCGLVDEKNPCSCKRILKMELEKGAQPEKRIYVSPKREAVKTRSEAMVHLKELSEIERVTELFRNYPKYHAPDAFKNIVKKLIDSR